MKKTVQFIVAAFVAMFTSPMREFRVTGIGQLQAKSGTITAGGGSNAELEAAVAQSDPKVATLAQTAIDALNESALEKVVALNTSNRKVRVAAAGDVAAVNTAAATGPMAVIVSIEKDDDTKSSSTMTAVFGDNSALSDAIVALTTAQKPSLTVGSLISKIEDVAEEIGIPVLVVIDQTTGQLRVYADSADATGASVEAADAALATAVVEEAIFTQTITVGSTAEKPFGE